MSIAINNLNMHFDELTLFNNFTFEFAEGTISCILGPSGCGKTTLLNIIGGLQKPQSGHVLGIDKKSISYIFQEPRLLPWRTVQQNIELVLANAYDEPNRRQVARKFIDLVELNGFENYYPSQLSGGMRQRVSIARAFAYPSDLILMDEPLKGLDVKLKLTLIKAFARIWKADKRSVLFVTHDVDEALLLGHNIVVFNHVPIAVELQQTIADSITSRDLSTQKFLALKNELLSVLNR